MAGSRAASAREPGQIREEAALSDTARAPRTSLAGADDRRARPGTSFEDGCTVRAFLAMGNADVIRELARRWNAGDVEGVLELFAEDAVMLAGGDWPEQTPRRGREDIRANIEEWRAVWESAELEIARTETFGDRLVADGAWNARGRSSGVTGSMPAITLCTIRHGKIACLEWFTDYDAAVAAARGS
jgi:ketosteroid isomerase-like protein